MRQRPIPLTGLTKINRHDAISAIDDAVLGAGGWVVNHTLFSNIAAAFRLAVPASGLGTLSLRLETSGIHLDQAGKDALAATERMTADGNSEVFAALNVTFIHDEPDLRHEIPSVPG